MSHDRDKKIDIVAEATAEAAAGATTDTGGRDTDDRSGAVSHPDLARGESD